MPAFPPKPGFLDQAGISPAKHRTDPGFGLEYQHPYPKPRSD